MAENANDPPVKEYGNLDMLPSSFYQEMTIFNCTQDIIVVIDKHGKHTELPPVRYDINQTPCVRVITRTSVGYQGDKVPRGKSPGIYRKPKMAGKEVVITYTDILERPRYVKSVDLVFCTKDDAERTKHPRIAATFHEALLQLMDDDATKYKEKELHMTAFAEHPDEEFVKQHPNVYIFLFGKLMSYPLRYNPNCVKGYFRFVIYVGKCRVTTLDAGIEEMTGGAVQVKLRGFACVISLDEQAAYKEAECLYRVLQNIIPTQDPASPEDIAQIRAEAEERLKQVSESYEKKIQTLKNDYDAKISALNLKLANASEEVQKLTIEFNRLKELNAQMQAATEMMDRNRARDYALIREEHQTKRIQTASETEKVKYDGVVWKIVGGITIAGVTAFLTYLGSRRK